jgi:hypothetical protein
MGWAKVSGDNDGAQPQKYASIQDVWVLVRPVDRATFWEFAAAEAQNHKATKGPRRSDDLYADLSAAIYDVDHKPAQRKSSVVGLPRATKRLSASDLQKAVRRLRDKLLQQPLAEGFLINSFCRWVQLSRTQVLVACLSALKCGHDEVGNLKGEIPAHSGQSSCNAVLPLAESIDPYDLALVCCALALNNYRWAPLWSCVNPLLAASAVRSASGAIEPTEDSKRPAVERAASTADMPMQAHAPETPTYPPANQARNEPESQQTMSQPDTPGSAEPNPISDGLCDLNGLCQRLKSLGDRLVEASLLMNQGILPEASSIATEWQELTKLVAAACDVLQISTNDVKELQHVADKRSSLSSRAPMLHRLLSLRHRSDAGYNAHASVVSDAREALELLQSSRDTELERLLPGLEAVDSLVRADGELNEVEAAQHDETVRKAYGGLLAVTLQRGKLTYDLAESHPATPLPSVKSVVAALDDTKTLDAANTGGSAPSERAAPAPTVNDEIAPSNAPLNEQAPAALPANEAPTERGDEGTPPPTEAESLSSSTAKPVPTDERTVSGTEDLQVGQVSSLPFTPTFEAFRRLTWIGTTGSVQLAPWRAESFRSDLRVAAHKAWGRGEIGMAYLFATTGGEQQSPFYSDINAADALVERPLELPTLRSVERTARLRAALDGSQQDDPTLALALTMESVAPTFPTAWSLEDVEVLTQRAGLRSPALQPVLSFMLTGWSSTGDPLTLIRNFIKDAPADAAGLSQQLKSAQADLQQVVATLWNAAGGRIQRTHCKKAWTSFVRDHVAPLRDALAPTKPQGNFVESTAQHAELQIAALGKAFSNIMNDGGVRHADLTAAQSAAYQIVAAIQKVVDYKRQLESHRKRTQTAIQVPRAEIEQLMGDLPSDILDRFCVLMLRAAWRQEPVSNPARLPSGWLSVCPDLLKTLWPSSVSNLDAAKGIAVSDIQDPLFACELLTTIQASPAQVSDRGSLLEGLRLFGIENERTDILAALVPAGCLEPHEVTQLGKRALELGDRAFESTRELELVWADCDVLLAPEASMLRAAVDEAYNVCDFAAGDAPIAQTMLLQAWLDRALDKARQIRSRVLEVRIQEAARMPAESGKKFKEAIHSGNYRGAMEMLHPSESLAERDDAPVRRTLWRSEAVRKFPNPRASLVTDLRSTDATLNSLISWWVSPGENDQNYRDTLRKSLYNLISGEAGHAQEVNKRRFGGRLAELRQHKERKTVINCRVLRDWFQATKLNPTFLPQLADLDEIVLASLPTTANASNAVDVYVRAATAEQPRVLSVFLEPNVAPGRRDEVAAGLRKRQVAAVILDDIDICRLCLAGSREASQDFVPFLEVVFEQLDLELISPFSSLDGQHVRLESFVGRQQYAESIAHGWEFSRLFSGRKLGKSAFLRYVASRYDEEKSTATGKKLNVLFISIAGGSSAEYVVDTIISEMNRRFNLWFEAESNALNNSIDRFAAYMKRFADARRDQNVLIILDEADAFVEEQLRRYEKERDSSLSFNMMKRMPESADHGMPRVRFLFAGYRVTNTRGGVWANAGDVLILKPLTESEASDFLHGMLGRIGVDIGNHAKFAARRCGYQPAVLIRFGDALLKRIRRNSRSPMREHYEVSHEDIQAVMLDPAVAEEIRTVVNNNFQGNRVAAAVFAATLLALKDLEPGIALEDGAKQVLAKLRAIDEDTQWLASRGSDPLAQVERKLQEFVDRELLTVTEGGRFGVREYRLKFPNFGAVVAQHQDLALEIKQHIQYLRSDDAPAGVVESVLPDSSLDAIRYIFRTCTSEECAMVITAGHWPEALIDQKAGIPDRLGYSIRAVTTCTDATALQQKLPTYRIFRSVDAEMLPTFLGVRTQKPLLLLGGIDLLRASLKRLLEGGDMTIDLRPLLPMSQTAVAWWFQDVRANAFKRADALDQIFKATEGIPLLVGEFAQHLPPPSFDVTDSDMAAATTHFFGAIPRLARELQDGPATVRLDKRELDLLRMAGKVASELQQDFDLQSELPDAWDMCNVVGPVPPFSDEDDRTALQLLMCVGLLPAARGTDVSAAGKLGRVTIQKGSTLAKLIEALGPLQ